MWNLRFHNNFIFRSPAYPFSKENLTIDKLKEIASQDEFQRAIYVSSPVLYNELRLWLKGELKREKDEKKLVYSLSKYLSRIQTRCTPYGLFASCSTGEWGTKSEIVQSQEVFSHTRLDMDLFCDLIQYLSEHSSIKPWLLFYPNNSIYAIGDELRYIEHKYVNDARSHVLKNIDKDTYVIKILDAAKKGIQLKSIEELLVNDVISLEDARNFIEEIVKSQLLVSELEPTVTGEEFLAPLLRTLKRIHAFNPNEQLGNTISILLDIEERIELLDNNAVLDVTAYMDLVNEIKKLQTHIKAKTFVQVDAYRNASVANLNINIQKGLIKVIDFLGKITQPYENPDLVNFKNKFYEVYEEREMPLLEVLDKESGIGYPSKDISGVNPLVDDFIIVQNPNVTGQQGWSQRDRFLLKRLMEANKQDLYTIKFKDEDIADFPKQDGKTTITMSLMVKFLDVKKNKIQVSYIGGNSSAANLLGRFAHGDEKILEIIKDIAVFEKNALEDRILAEIVHLPQSRLGNIILRPVFRDYEIPYIGKSAMSEDFQIIPDDLWVSVKNGRVVLKSKRLDKEILPRLTTAHNFNSSTSLPVYKFLGDMQIQDINMPAFSFYWGGFSKSFKFLPRAEYDDIVLMPATWNLLKSDYNILLKNITSNELMQEVNAWMQKWKMPRYILLKDGDNELFVDLESEMSIKTFLDIVKKRTEIELVEFLFDIDSSLIHDENGNSYSNEIIAVLFNDAYKKVDANDKVKTSSLNRISSKNSVKRAFTPGSEWLFYKLYCGVSSADKILVRSIKPLVEELIGKGLVEKWFFIRYADPDFHIRLRFYTESIDKIGEIIKLIHKYLNPLYENGVISKIMNDTYVRELERYGDNTIEISEQYFAIESNMTLHLLANVNGEKAEDLKLFYALRSIDELLDAFYFTSGQKIVFIEEIKTAYVNEHGGHKELKLKLDDKFRDRRKTIDNILNRKEDNEIEYVSVVNLLNWRKLQLRPVIDRILKINGKRQLKISLNKLLSSYLHMNVNRIFTGKQRTHEMVIYDMLHKYYISKLARESKAKQAQVSKKEIVP